MGDREKLSHVVKQYLINAEISSDAAIIIDDLTYDLASDHQIVIPATYLTWLGYGHPDILKSFIDKYDITYGVVQCNMMPIINSLLPTHILYADIYIDSESKEIKKIDSICIFKHLR